LELTIDDVLSEFFLDRNNALGVVLSEVLDSVLHDVVTESFDSSWERNPVRFEVTKNSTVNWDHPIVREVLVTNLTHLWLL